MKKFLLVIIALTLQAICSDIHICYVSDENYAMPTKISLKSLLQNSNPGDNLNIHIVDFGITTESKIHFENLKIIKDFNLDFVNFDITKFAELKEYDWPLQIYCKFFFQDIFPGLNKLIFLDGDTIVDRSFKELWKLDLKDNYWAGTDHHGYFSFPHSPENCVAVMLLNLAKFREDNLAKKLIDNTIKCQKYCKKYTEENALQNVCKGKILTIPFKYNIHIFNIPTVPVSRVELPQSTLNLFSEMKNAVVWHYSGKMKPWNTAKEDFSKRYPAFLFYKWWDYAK